VYLILEKLGAEETVEQILAAYPQITRDHITTATLFSWAGTRRDRSRVVKILLDENLSPLHAAFLRGIGL
jgi:uncharacterized protein (DUF433 family)